jgi:hypothetical protein
MAKGIISLAALLTVWVILPGCDGFSSQSLHPSLRPKASNDLGSRFSCPSLAGARLPAPLQRQMAIMESSYSHVSMPHVSMQLDFVDKLGKMGLGFGGPKVRAEEDVKSFCFSKVAVSPSLQGVASEATEAGRSDGKPKENQDKCVVLKDIFDGISMYSVFDGHGSYGGQVAEWLTQQVPSDIKNALYRCGSPACTQPPSLLRGTAQPPPSQQGPASRTRLCQCRKRHTDDWACAMPLPRPLTLPSSTDVLLIIIPLPSTHPFLIPSLKHPLSRRGHAHQQLRDGNPGLVRCMCVWACACCPFLTSREFFFVRVRVSVRACVSGATSVCPWRRE